MNGPETARSNWGREAAFLLKAARPGFWTTTIWFYFLPLGGRAVFGSAGFWLGLAVVTFPLGLLIYGWNDLVDAETDRLNPRKDTYLFGARPTPAQRRRLPGWILAVQLPCFLLIAQELGVARAAGWYATIGVAVALYNQPPFSFKGRPPFEVLNQAGYLVVFVLSSWLNHLPQLPWPTFVFGAAFAMHSHLFGEIMDEAPDRHAGRRTTATLLGMVPAKLLIAALLAAEAAWVWFFFRDGWIAAFLGASAGWFVADALVLWRRRPYEPWQMRAFFLGWNIIAVASLPLIWASATLTTVAGAERPEALVILTGDQHSAYDRTAQVVATVDRLKAEHPGLPLAILLNGDTLEYGNIVARRSAGAVDFAMFAALARRAPTVVNVGNHEPEFYDLAETVARLQATGVIVVSNITNRATGQLFAPASARIQLGATEAVVVGVTTDSLATYRVAVRPSLDLADPVAWAQQNFPRLLGVERLDSKTLDDSRGGEKRVEGNALHLSIVLSHAGIKADRGLLPLVPSGTLFAGAHDHQRFVQPFDHGVYVHSGSWNEYLSLAWLHRDAAGAPRWEVEQVRLEPDGPADPELAALIGATRQKYLTPEDTALVARLPAALGPAAAARRVTGALRAAAGVDAAFIGNTTFGAGLPAGGVSREQFDACVRFDGTIFTAEVDGARLRQLLAAANLGPDTPFEQRRGEFSFADGPAEIDPAKTYRLATTDWGAKNTARYFGEPAIGWREQPGLKLKAAVLSALARP